MKTHYPYKLGQALIALAVSIVVWPSGQAAESPLDRYVAKPDPAYEYLSLIHI